MATAPEREARIQQIGRELLAAVAKEGSVRSASSLLSGRAVQRRLLARAVQDAHFRTQLFRFIDVYPSLRDSGDLVRHLRAYLNDRGEAPPPLDRLLATGSAQRLPSWAIARLTDRAMQRMAKGLIAGRDASEALPTLRRLRRGHTAFTIDILGEACLSESEAADYIQRYQDLLELLPPKVTPWSTDPLLDSSPAGAVPRVNVSVKITSFYSQIDPLDFEASRNVLVSKLRPLFLKAKEAGTFVNIDLERYAYRDLTYAVFADLALDPELRGYPHLGIVVQSYLRDSDDDLRLMVELAKRRETPITVRLVKGAYWDYETIIAAQEHWRTPVFATKAETDAQFEKLTKNLVDNWQWTRPALGTHNIRSMAAGLAAAEEAGLAPGAVELQVLHGMAEPIRKAAVACGHRVREYVPVGEVIPGMAYLVRRLLENTSNESFLRLTFAQEQDADRLLAAPGTAPAAADTATAEGAREAEEAHTTAADGTVGEPAMPVEEPVAPLEEPVAPTQQARASAKPAVLTPPPFQNEPHADFSQASVRAEMDKALATIRGSLGREYPLVIDGKSVSTATTTLSVNPARPDEIIGKVASATRQHADTAVEAARAALGAWRSTPGRKRAAVLFKAAGLMREQRFELAALEVAEAGKPWREADADVTEAIDFLEYYAREMVRLYRARSLSDIPGEDDLYFYEPRGVAAVIAPWNFPLAIPTGMVSAALVAGNPVVFKPAGPTPVIGYALVRILHEAGIPTGALHFLPGPGHEVGDYLAADPRVDLVAFTGSLDVGLSIMQKAATLAPGQRSLKKVIAELGGKNAIIVDTDADLDAAVEGVIASALFYGGQKCSACSRVIVMDEVHDQFVRRLVQAAASLKIGDPADPGTRLGPVITAEARDRILGYIKQGMSEAKLAFPPTGTPSIPPVTAPPTTPAGADEIETTDPTDPATLGTPHAPAGADNPAGPDKPDGAAGPDADAVSPEADVVAARTDVVAAQVDVVAARTDETAAPEEAASPTEETSTPGEKTAPNPEPGYFLLPHVFIDVPPQAVIAQEEIFGPVISVLKVTKFSEALELALGVRYGLTGGVYSRNPAHIRSAYNEFRVGNLYINRPITGAMVGRQPFGGLRMSGVGAKAGGPDYLLQFMEPRTITENTLRRGFAPEEPDGDT